jgi:hypothetical protein
VEALVPVVVAAAEEVSQRLGWLQPGATKA